MGIFKIIAIGTLGYVAYKALKNRQDSQNLQSAPATNRTTPPHGDPMRSRDTWEQEPEPVHAGAQFSRGFGEA